MRGLGITLVSALLRVMIWKLLECSAAMTLSHGKCAICCGSSFHLLPCSPFSRYRTGWRWIRHCVVRTEVRRESTIRLTVTTNGSSVFILMWMTCFLHFLSVPPSRDLSRIADAIRQSVLLTADVCILKKREGDQKIFCSPSYGLPNPRRLTSATPIRGISRLRCGPFGTFGSPLLFCSSGYPVTATFAAEERIIFLTLSMRHPFLFSQSSVSMR